MKQIEKKRKFTWSIKQKAKKINWWVKQEAGNGSWTMLDRGR
jgi:hypothetical protein